MINCNARGGIAMANSITDMSNRRLGTSPAAGLAGNVMNHVPNIVNFRATSRPNNNNAAVHVHNAGSLNDGSPLIMVSNIPSHSNNVGQLGPARVRSVSMLGSTSTTVCNTHTTGNMVLVAAGHKGRNGPIISFGTDTNFSRPAHLPGVAGSCRCTAVLGRILPNSFSSRRLRNFHARTGP